MKRCIVHLSDVYCFVVVNTLFCSVQRGTLPEECCVAGLRMLAVLISSIWVFGFTYGIVAVYSCSWIVLTETFCCFVLWLLKLLFCSWLASNFCYRKLAVVFVRLHKPRVYVRVIDQLVNGWLCCSYLDC